MGVPEKEKTAVEGGGRRTERLASRQVLSIPTLHKSPLSVNSTAVLSLPDGRAVGEVRGDALVKRVRGSAHMLRQPRGWACDVSVLREAERLGARWVEIHNLEDGTIYRAPLERFWTRGIRVNRGYGEQLALVLSDWSSDGQEATVASQLAFVEVLL